MRFEKMRMWQAAEQFVGEVDGIVEQVRFAAPNPADRLERSAESVLVNIAEGAGAFRPRVKIGCYDIARKESAVTRRAHRPSPAARRPPFQQCEETGRPIFRSTSGAT